VEQFTAKTFFILSNHIGLIRFNFEGHPEMNLKEETIDNCADSSFVLN